jgi:hypothetical protein
LQVETRVRTFIWIGVRFMAITCLACVLIAAYRLVVETLALNLPGMLFSVIFGLIVAASGYVFWTQTDGVVQDYIDQAESRAESWRALTGGRLGGNAASRVDNGHRRPGAAPGREPAAAIPVAMSVDDLRALHVHLQAADAELLSLAGENPDEPLPRWTRIHEWAVGEVAWADGLPEAKGLTDFRSEYLFAAAMAQGFADQVLAALRADDQPGLEDLWSRVEDVDARFRTAFETGNRLVASQPTA